MSKTKKFVVIFLLLLLVIITSIGIWQRKNIKAIYTAFTSNSENIAYNIEKQNQENMEILKKEFDVDVSLPTTEQTNELLEGKITAEELKSSLGLDNNSDINSEQSEKTTNLTTEDTASNNSNENTANDIVNNCVSELSSYKIDLMSQIGQLKNEAIGTWNSLPKEARTKSKMYEIGMAGLNKCYAIEATADANVKSVLNKYKSQLSNIGADTAIIDTLWNQYCSEKESQKAYYINMYMN